MTRYPTITPSFVRVSIDRGQYAFDTVREADVDELVPDKDFYKVEVWIIDSTGLAYELLNRPSTSDLDAAKSLYHRWMSVAREWKSHD